MEENNNTPTQCERRSERKRKRKESYSPDERVNDEEKKKKTEQKSANKSANRHFDVLPNGEPFSCFMCKSPYVVNPKSKGVKKTGRSRHTPLPRTRVDKTTGEEILLCNACVIIYDRPQRRVAKPVIIPTDEERKQYINEAEEFTKMLHTEWDDPLVEKLYCPMSQKKLCGCLQKHIKTSLNADKRDTVDTLLELMKTAIQLRKEKYYTPPDTSKLKRSIGLGNGHKKSKRYEEFVINERRILRDDFRLCERATQRVLMYSNNFLHKKLKTENRPCRIERTRGKNVLGKLPEFHTIVELHCCQDNCVMVALTHRRLLQDWRSRAQQSQAEARRVVAEMLTPAGACHINCYSFISMVTGCSPGTIARVYNHMIDTGGMRDPPEHGMKRFWQEQTARAGTTTEGPPDPATTDISQSEARIQNKGGQPKKVAFESDSIVEQMQWQWKQMQQQQQQQSTLQQQFQQQHDYQLQPHQQGFQLLSQQQTVSSGLIKDSAISRLLNRPHQTATTTQLQNSVIAQQLATPPMRMDTLSHTMSLNHSNPSLFQPLTLPPPPQYTGNQAHNGNQSEQFFSMMSLPANLNQNVNNSIKQANIVYGEGQYVNQMMLGNSATNNQAQRSALSVPLCSSEPFTVPKCQTVDAAVLKLLGSNTNQQLHGTGQMPTFQLVTDQGVFNIESIVSVPPTTVSEQAEVVDVFPSFNPTQKVNPEIHVEGLNSHTQPVPDNNIQMTSAGVLTPIQLVDKNTGLTQLVYMMNSAQGGAAVINNCTSKQQLVGTEHGRVFNEDDNNIDAIDPIINVNKNIPTVVSMTDAGNVTIAHAIKTRVPSQEHNTGIHENRQSNRIHTITSDASLEHETNSSVKTCPSHLHVSYGTNDNGHSEVQEFVYPHSNVITLTLPQINTLNTNTENQAQFVEHIDENGTLNIHRSSSETSTENVIHIVNTVQEPITCSTKLESFPKQALKPLAAKLIKSSTKSKEVQEINLKDPNKSRRSRNPSIASNKSRNASGASDISKRSITPHIGTKVSFEDVVQLDFKGLPSDSFRDINNGSKLKFEKARSRQTSGNSEVEGRSRKSSGNSLFSETSFQGILPFSNLSSPNIFLDKDKGIFFIHPMNIEGVDFSEIVSSAALDEMIQPTDEEHVEQTIKIGADDHGLVGITPKDQILPDFDRRLVDQLNLAEPLNPQCSADAGSDEISLITVSRGNKRKSKDSPKRRKKSKLSTEYNHKISVKSVTLSGK